MRFVTASLFSAALLISYSSLAGEPKQEMSEQPDAAPKPEEAKENKKICRRVSEGMGSRSQTRLCLTREQWLEYNNQ